MFKSLLKNTASSETLLNIISRIKKGGVIINEHILSKEQTIVHIDVLGRFFDFIHHDDLLKCIKNPGKRPFCLLTFDDGSQSNYLDTAPVLERMGVPAIFFIVTGALTSGNPLWFNVRKSIIQKLGFTPRSLNSKYLKQKPIDLLLKHLEHERENYNLNDIKILSSEMLPMTWENAKDLTKRGFTIGAHTVNHAILTNETPEKAKFEIKKGIEEVTTHLHISCDTFAFPNGNYNPMLAQYALECGVQTVMTTEPMWVDKNFPAWRLPRIQIFQNQSASRIRRQLATAATGRILENPDGQGKSYVQMHRRWKERVKPS